MPRLASTPSAAPSAPSFLRARSLLLAAPLAALALGACNDIETGHYGEVDFTPDDCGQVGCDLDDRLAVGATTEIRLDGVAGRDVSDLDLVSDDPSVMDVISRDGAWPTFTIVGKWPGRTDLVAIDEYGDEVDYIHVNVVAIDDIVFDVEGDYVKAPDRIVLASGQPADRYRITANTRVSITAHAEADLRPVMGKFEYGVVVGPAVAEALTGSSKPGQGRFDMYAPRGEHDLVLTAPGGAWKRIHLTVE